MIEISLVTPTLNSAIQLPFLLDKLSTQSLQPEHIIIDGGSTDITLEILGKYAGSSMRYISEPDQGPYDAMNKGIEMATGDVIGILNADDFYTDERVLESVLEVFEDPSVDSCYGDLDYVDRNDVQKVVRRWKAGPYQEGSWYRGWMPPHPTFFVRKHIYEKFGLYRLDMGTSADYELMLRFLLRHRIKTRYIPQVLVKMRTGGLSNRTLINRLRANRMDRRAWKVNGLKPGFWTLAMKPASKIRQFKL